jgi:hypothetical protein
MIPTWFSRHDALTTRTTLVEALMQTIQGSKNSSTKWVIDLEEQHEGIESTYVAFGSGVIV